LSGADVGHGHRVPSEDSRGRSVPTLLQRPAGRPDMIRRQTVRRVLVALPCLALALAAPVFGDLRASAVPWTELQFRARKLGFSVTADMKLASSPAATVAGKLVSPEEGSGVPPGGTVASILLTSGFAGRNSEITVFFDPETGQALQQQQLDTGKRNRFRVTRFCEEGIDSRRQQPAEGEAKRPHEEWTDRSRNWEAYPGWAGDDLLVVDPTALFYIVAAAPLEKPGDRYQVPVFTKGNLILVEMTVRAIDKARVDYASSSAGSSRVKGSVDALRISLDAQHLDPDSKETDLELLGLRGDVEMLVDREKRLPLEISGKVPIAGTVRVRLVEAKLR
jgi:hypothetical protein